jgi:ubiquinone/menaquinone biosynthesis C-methylase UbiE
MYFPRIRVSPLMSPSPWRTPLAMIGAKAGDQVIVIGAGDGRLAAEVALVTGLNGRLLVVDASQAARARVDAAAARAGALLEFTATDPTALPAEEQTFDVAVLHMVLAGLSDATRVAAAGEVYRVVKPGGRLVVLEGGTQARFFGLTTTPASGLGYAVVSDVLTSAGWRTSRLLADVGGVVYTEAIRAR